MKLSSANAVCDGMRNLIESTDKTPMMIATSAKAIFCSELAIVFYLVTEYLNLLVTHMITNNARNVENDPKNAAAYLALRYCVLFSPSVSIAAINADGNVTRMKIGTDVFFPPVNWLL